VVSVRFRFIINPISFLSCMFAACANAPRLQRWLGTPQCDSCPHRNDEFWSHQPLSLDDNSPVYHTETLQPPPSSLAPFLSYFAINF
jgi:hypothetical protein